MSFSLMEAGPLISWEIAFQAREANGPRWLKYTASGQDLAEAVASSKFPLSVEDEKPTKSGQGKPTEMMPTDRKDLRKAVHTILSGALAAAHAKTS